MSGKEKLYFLLDRMCDIRAIAPINHPVIIDPANDLNRKLRYEELIQLFTKLEVDEKLIQVVHAPSRIKQVQVIEELDPYEKVDDGNWYVQILPKFDDYYLAIQEQPEYQSFTGKTPSPKSLSKQIADQFSSINHNFVLMVLKEILALSDFGVDGKVSYPLQSSSGSDDLVKERGLLLKLERFGLFRHLGEDGIYGIARLSNLDIPTLREVIDRLEGKPVNQPQSTVISVSPQPAPQAPYWQDDFGWEGDCYSFGKFGKTKEIISPYKKKLIDALAIEKGNWATIKKLKEATGKDEKYIRTTIGQIENSFDPELRKHLSIPSTLGADSTIPTPNQGAYRFALTP